MAGKAEGKQEKPNKEAPGLEAISITGDVNKSSAYGAVGIKATLEKGEPGRWGQAAGDSSVSAIKRNREAERPQ